MKAQVLQLLLLDLGEQIRFGVDRFQLVSRRLLMLLDLALVSITHHRALTLLIGVANVYAEEGSFLARAADESPVLGLGIGSCRTLNRAFGGFRRSTLAALVGEVGLDLEILVSGARLN